MATSAAVVVVEVAALLRPLMLSVREGNASLASNPKSSMLMRMVVNAVSFNRRVMGCILPMIDLRMTYRRSMPCRIMERTTSRLRDGPSPDISFDDDDKPLVVDVGKSKDCGTSSLFGDGRNVFVVCRWHWRAARTASADGPHPVLELLV